MDSFELSAHERHSELWKRLKKHFEARLDAHRRNNDEPASEERTARLRGRIAEMKYIVGLDQDTLPVDDEDVFKD